MKAIARTLRSLSAALARMADRLDPPAPIQFGAAQEAERFRERLAAEAREQMFTPAYCAQLDRALDICYGERPTTYTRKLRAIQGGRR